MNSSEASSSSCEMCEVLKVTDSLRVRDVNWMVFWDIENTSPYNKLTGAQIVHAITTSILSLRESNDKVKRITLIADIVSDRFREELRQQLFFAGVCLSHVEVENRSEAADKALIVSMVKTMIELDPLKWGVALLSGDQDFAYPLARLRALLLMSVPDYVLSFQNDVLKDLPQKPVKLKKKKKMSLFGCWRLLVPYGKLGLALIFIFLSMTFLMYQIIAFLRIAFNLKFTQENSGLIFLILCIFANGSYFYLRFWHKRVFSPEKEKKKVDKSPVYTVVLPDNL